PLVVWSPLPEPAKVPEVAARRENSTDAGHFRDLIGVFQTFECFDHQDQHDVVVDSVAVTAWYAAPHAGVEGLATAVTAAPKRRKVGPIARLHGFFDRVHSRDDDDERARVERMLNFALVGVSDSHARYGSCLRTGAPHARDSLPIPLVVLHFCPRGIVARRRPCAVGRGGGPRGGAGRGDLS